MPSAPRRVRGLHRARRLVPQEDHHVFRPAEDLVFHRKETLPFHANGMRFAAFDAEGAELANRCYYSVGGGFVVSDEVVADGSRQKVIAPDTTVLAHPFRSGDDDMTPEHLARLKPLNQRVGVDQKSRRRKVYVASA